MKIKYDILKTALILSAIFLIRNAWSQSSQIELVHADTLASSGQIQNAAKLIGNVHFKNQNLNLFCDSALFHQTDNWVKAYGRVQINQGDTLNLYSDSLYFDGNTNIGKLQSNVKIRDNSFKLNTDSLNFNTSTSVAFYTNYAFIISNDESLTLTSTKGTYYSKTKTFIFKDSVELVHPDYRVESDTLEFHANEEDILIHGPSTIWLDSTTIITKKAIYHTITNDMQLWQKATIFTSSQMIQGDSLSFNSETENAKGYQNIFIQDTLENVDLRSDFMTKTANLIELIGNAQIFQYQSSDTIGIQADTISQFNDTLTKESIQIAQSNVIIEQGELIGRCDSLFYSEKDSIIKLQKKPIVWQTNTELSADSISINMIDKTVNSMNLFQNAFVSIEHDSLHFDQCSGKLISVSLDSNRIKKIDILENAETIYFPSEDTKDSITNHKNKVLKGVNYMLSNNITLIFENEEIEKISFIDQPDATFKPLKDAKKTDLFLKKFKYQKYLKPVSILKNLSYFSDHSNIESP